MPPRLNAIVTRFRTIAEWVTTAMFSVVFFIYLAGIAARYVFSSPIAWSDELAMIVFLWCMFLTDAFVGNDDVFLSVSGHDHVNSFIGTVRGVDFASAPGATFTSYNTRETRGVRLFRFREDAVRDYDTTFVPFSDYDGAEGIGAVSYWLTTTTGVFYRPYKTILVVLVLSAILFFLFRSLLRLDSRDRSRARASSGSMRCQPVPSDLAGLPVPNIWACMLIMPGSRYLPARSTTW